MMKIHATAATVTNAATGAVGAAAAGGVRVSKVAGMAGSAGGVAGVDRPAADGRWEVLKGTARQRLGDAVQVANQVGWPVLKGAAKKHLEQGGQAVGQVGRQAAHKANEVLDRVLHRRYSGLNDLGNLAQAGQAWTDRPKVGGIAGTGEGRVGGVYHNSHDTGDGKVGGPVKKTTPKDTDGEVRGVPQPKRPAGKDDIQWLDPKNRPGTVDVENRLPKPWAWMGM